MNVWMVIEKIPTENVKNVKFQDVRIALLVLIHVMNVKSL